MEPFPQIYEQFLKSHLFDPLRIYSPALTSRALIPFTKITLAGGRRAFYGRVIITKCREYSGTCLLVMLGAWSAVGLHIPRSVRFLAIRLPLRGSSGVWFLLSDVSAAISKSVEGVAAQVALDLNLLPPQRMGPKCLLRTTWKDVLALERGQCPEV